MKRTAKLPKVSIVVPTRNCTHTISALLDSLQKLLYPNYEVIVVDSSIDGTDKIALNYGVKVVYTSQAGLNIARNIGIRSSSGDIICFIDGDCEAPPDWVNKIVSEFKKDPRTSCVGGSVLAKSKTFWGRYLNESITPIFPKYAKPDIIKKKSIDLLFYRKQLPVGCNVAIKWKSFEELGGFDEKWRVSGDDSEFLYRMLKHLKRGYHIAVNPEIVVYHQSRPLSELIRQVYKYGKGGRRFGKKYKFPMLKNKIKATIIGGLTSLLFYSKLYKETRKLSVLSYLFVDLLVVCSYYLGFVLGKE